MKRDSKPTRVHVVLWHDSRTVAERIVEAAGPVSAIRLMVSCSRRKERSIDRADVYVFDRKQRWETYVRSGNRWVRDDVPF